MFVILPVMPVLAFAYSWFSAVLKCTAMEQSALKIRNLDAITEGKKQMQIGRAFWNLKCCICAKTCFKFEGEQTRCSHIVNENT